MNKLEAKRATELDALQRVGEVKWYRFEGLTLLLAPRTRYTPDFFIQWADGSLMLEETKGHWRDDARVKIKVAAELYPMFAFRALRPRRKKDGGGWNVENF